MSEGSRPPTSWRAPQRAGRYFAGTGAECVGYFGLNSEVLPVALFGAAMAGVPFSPINYRAPDEQLGGIVARVAGGLMIADDDEVERLGACGATHIVTKGEFAAAIAFEGNGDGDGGGEDEFAFVDPEDVGVLLFTSGTTSEPKAAVLRHRHLVSYIITSVEFLGCAPDEAQLICVPPYHIAGVAAVLSSLYAGRRIMYLPSFDAAEWVRLAVDEHITHAMVVPTMLGRILDAAESAGVKLDSLRHLSYGGGRMPLELVERTLRDMPHVDLVNAYGLTETSSTIAMLTPDEHREAFASDDPAVRARLSSVGRPLPSLGGGGARRGRRRRGARRERRDLGARRAGGRRVRRALRLDRGRVVPHPRRRLVRRRRLPLRRRPAGRRDRAGIREPLARGDRRGPHAASRRGGGRGDRGARRRVGRGGRRSGGAARGAVGGRGRAAELGPRAVALHQDARRRRLPRRAPLLPDGEAPAAGAARRALGPRGSAAGAEAGSWLGSAPARPACNSAPSLRHRRGASPSRCMPVRQPPI